MVFGAHLYCLPSNSEAREWDFRTFCEKYIALCHHMICDAYNYSAIYKRYIVFNQVRSVMKMERQLTLADL